MPRSRPRPRLADGVEVPGARRPSGPRRHDHGHRRQQRRTAGQGCPARLRRQPVPPLAAERHPQGCRVTERSGTNRAPSGGENARQLNRRLCQYDGPSAQWRCLKHVRVCHCVTYVTMRVTLHLVSRLSNIVDELNARQLGLVPTRHRHYQDAGVMDNYPDIGIIVHHLRNSFEYASEKGWVQIAKDLKPFCTAASEAGLRRWTGSPSSA